MEKKQVILDYNEHERLLEEISKAQDYIKELEKAENIIIIDRNNYSGNYYSVHSYPTITKGIDSVTDKLKELEEELDKAIKSKVDSEAEYKRSYYNYNYLSRKLESNWIYKLFYSKDK